MALEINTTDDGQIQFNGLFEDLQMGPLLLWILEEEQQGELTITIDGLQQVIYFADGYPVGTRGGAAENFLGWLLREKGDIDDSTYLTSLQRMADEQNLQGQILLQMGAIDEQQLQEALVMQLRRKLIRLFGSLEGEFYFISMPELPIFDIAIGDLNPYTLTANAVRQEFSHTRLEYCLSSLKGYAVRLDPDGQWIKKVKKLHLEDDELEALSLLENWNTIEHFIQQRYLDPTPCKVLIALLFSTNLLELDDADEHQDLEYTVDPPVRNQVHRAGVTSDYSYTSEDEGVSIKVETAKRPEGPKKDPNAPRTRASVTVHVKEDRMETHSEIPIVGHTQPFGQIQEELPEEFILPQDDEVKTDPSIVAVSPAVLQTDQPLNSAVFASSPNAAVISNSPPRDQSSEHTSSPVRGIASRATVEPIAPVVPPEEKQVPMGELSPEESELKTKITKKKASLARATFYEVLEVTENSDENELRKAYYAQSRTFHPDSVAGTPLESYKDDLDVIFSRLNEAYSILCNPTKREEYDRILSDPEAAELEERAPKAAQAEVFFSKANVFIKMRDFASAEEQLQWACKLLDDVGDYQVLLAWAIYNNPERGADEKLQKALFHLDNAEKSTNTEEEKMRWYWGCILQQENELSGALQQFKMLLKQNPKHIEAIREVRNLNALIRKEKGAEDKKDKTEKKGLFGFLKK